MEIGEPGLERPPLFHNTTTTSILVIPKNPEGGPLNDDLRFLGLSFSSSAAPRPSMAVLPSSPNTYLKKPISIRGLFTRRSQVRANSAKATVFMASLPERSAASTTKATEMVSIPDALGSSPSMEEPTSEEPVSRSKHAEAIVFSNGSFKFDIDLSSQGLESTLNKLSKWIVAALFGIAILWKHDAEAMWMGMGSVVNALLSNQLKQIINHQRPDPSLRSDPGMPSSHAQSIFYATSYVVISLIDSWGINVYTTSLATFTVACGVYLSWLRVSQRLHTVAQVGVGAAVGSAFSLGWFLLWRGLLVDAFASALWVRIMVFFLSIGFCLGFLIYVVRNWLADDYESL